MTTRAAFASMFTGGGGWDVGAQQLGLRPAWGVELDPRIAEVYWANFGHRPLVMDATKLTAEILRSLERPKVFCASPPCQAHAISRMRANVVPRLDADAGKAVELVLREMRPEAVLIENVPFYRHHPIMAEMRRVAESVGYVTEDPVIVDCNEYGTPSSRQRMVARMRLGPMPPRPRKHSGGSWYAAVRDLLPTFRPDKLAAWQIARLDRMQSSGVVMKFPVLVSSNNVSTARFKAGGTVLVARNHDEPAWTIAATYQAMSQTRIVFDREYKRVVVVDPRAFARWQSFPDTYKLPTSENLATRVVGNAVPPALARAWIGSLLV